MSGDGSGAGRAPPHGQAPAPGPRAEPVPAGETVRIPLIEETARLDRRTHETGRVRVSIRSESTEQVLRETLQGNAVGVTRVPVGRTLAEGEAVPRTRTEGGVTVIPVLEEILVVEKRLVLREEVHIRETRTGEEVEVPITLRRQRALVERVGADGAVTDVADPSRDAPPSEETQA